MSDIVERLKRRAAPLTRARELSPTAALCREAATEIERLRGITCDVAQSVGVPSIEALREAIADGWSHGNQLYDDFDETMRQRFDCAARAVVAIAAQPPAAPVEADAEIEALERTVEEASKTCNSHLERALKAEAKLAAHNGCSAGSEPVAWRYGRKDWGREIWRHVSSVPEFERPGDWIIEPLYGAVPQTSGVQVSRTDLVALIKSKARVSGHDAWEGGYYYLSNAEEIADAILSAMPAAAPPPLPPICSWCDGKGQKK